jgi:hypothetical protein
LYATCTAVEQSPPSSTSEAQGHVVNIFTSLMISFPLISSRTLCFALLVFSSIVGLSLLSELSFPQYVLYPKLSRFSDPSFCSPEAYAAGKWTRKHGSSPLRSKDGVLAVSGFQGCASSREVDWHLGTSWNAEDEFTKLQWRGNASSYDWFPGAGCEDYSKVDAAVLVRQLVEEGGWLILGGLLYACRLGQKTYG